MDRLDQIITALRNEKKGVVKIADVGICTMCSNFAGGTGADNLPFCSPDCEDEYRIQRQTVKDEELDP